jgi:hypothetical protein
MKDADEQLLDEFLTENSTDSKSLDILAVLGDLLDEEDPSDDVLRTILADARVEDRFAQFRDEVGKLLDLDAAATQAVLAGIDRGEGWFSDPNTGAQLCWVDGGPIVKDAVCGFVRMPAGSAFPEHTHLGMEHVLVLQGSYVDSFDGKVGHPGDVISRFPGSRHSFSVPEDGPDLLLLTVVHQGYEVAGVQVTPADLQND